MLLKRAQSHTPSSPAAPASSAKPKSCISEYHNQAQSAFFRRLPAEIRNEIYMLVFAAENIPTTASSSSSPPQPPPPHPLSLLLTCHRTHHESAPLAFHTHAFRLPARAATYIALQARASALSRAHRLTLRTLSTPHGSSAGAQLANALLVFPGLQRFSIHIARAPGRVRVAHSRVSDVLRRRTAGRRARPGCAAVCAVLGTARDRARGDARGGVCVAGG